MTNESNCLLGQPIELTGGPGVPCAVAGDPDRCSTICPHFIALHGASGSGGRVAAADIPSEYARFTLGNSPVRSEQPEAYRAADQYSKTFIRQFTGERIKSVYLFSQESGTGKTTTAAALANEYLLRHYLGSIKRGKAPQLRPVYFLDVNEFQTTYNKFNRSGIPVHMAEPASERYYTQLQLAQDTPFVVMDDIGVRTATEGFRGDLHSLINHRTVRGLPTVYTSNIPINELAQVFEPRLYDRIRDMCLDIPFKGESKRGRR